MDYNKAALEMHETHKGKVGIVSKVEVATRDDLSTAYTPGVAEPCRKIKENPDDVVTDDKYYVKGIRLSGRDNNETLAAPSFTVDKDADYVVAYGIKGNMVAYTVNYQDASGNSLAESQTFYGNVGDKPVVAYRYVENYIPYIFSNN